MADDRDYYFVTWTVDTGVSSRDDVVGWLGATVRPAWLELVEAGVLHNARVLWRTGDIDRAETPMEWTVMTVAEVSDGVDAGQAALAEREAFGRRGFAPTDQARLLGVDVLCRRRSMETPTPRPSDALTTLPTAWCPAVVQTDFPSEHLEVARAVMRDFHGPVARLLVDRGDAYRVIITEVVESRVRHPACPPWNHLSILEGDWSGGFEDAVRRTVSDVVATDDDALLARAQEVHALERSRHVSRTVEIGELGVSAVTVTA